MKNAILRSALTFALSCLFVAASAVPAKPGKHIYIQPDGSTKTVIVHGDEWFHYTTDESGRILQENAAGFLVEDRTATFETISQKMTLARLRDKMAAQNNLQPFRINASASVAAAARVGGSPKIPVVLVEFSDKAFKITNPKQAFTDLLMKKGYSANGGTGSVLDYYTDQSRGAYTPEFVVMDVVTLTGTMSTYGSTDENAAKAIYEACQKLDSTVDFSQFDNDKDGKVDMILMYFAGYNQAEGGPAATIWPHQFYVPYVVTNAQSFDGVKLDRYFCTSELKGSSGTNMCGIGTTCHEFAHSIGLPDMYDTNYDEYGDGEAGATYEFDVMCSGSYNNGGCTPPSMNAEELVMLGWMDGITEITGSSNITLTPISATTPVAYKTATSDAGEYFLYECRSGLGWDAPIPGGLVIYHVDKSKNRTITWKRSSYQSGSSTPYNLWANWNTYNAINCNGSHPCFYIIPSGNLTSLNAYNGPYVFPGTKNVTSYTPVDWNKQESSLALVNIAFDSSAKTASFDVINANIPCVSGKVTDSKGAPLQDAVVVITSASGFADKMVVDEQGKYEFELEQSGEYTIRAAKSGYQSESVTLNVSRTIEQNFTLMGQNEQLPDVIELYPADAQWGNYGSSSTSSWTQMAANCYTAATMAPYVGRQIKSISFCIYGTSSTTGTVYALLQVGSTMKHFATVSKPSVTTWNTVDVSAKKIMVEAGKDIYAGYALNKWRNSNPFIACAAEDGSSVGYLSAYSQTNPFIACAAEDGSSVGYLSAYSQTKPSWQSQAITFKVKIELMPGESMGGSQADHCYIEDLCGGVYSAGEVFECYLVESSDADRNPDASGVTWAFDNEPVKGTSVILPSSGVHTISATYTTAEGKLTVMELEVNVR